MKKKISMILMLFFSLFFYGQEKVSYESKIGLIEFEVSKEKQYFEFVSPDLRNIENDVKDLVLISGNQAVGDISGLKDGSLLLKKISPVLIYGGDVEQVVKDEIILKTKMPLRILNLFKQWELSVNFEKNLWEPDLYLVKCPVMPVQQFFNLVSNLNKIADVEYAEPNFIVFLERTTNDPLFDQQWGLKNTGQFGGIAGNDINVQPAWSLSTGQGIKVAVLDEGVDISHPDLAQNILPGYDVFGITEGIAAPNDSHGTSCSGIIAGVTHNEIGIAGIAYDAKIIPIRIAYVMPNGRWYSETLKIADGINVARIRGADVLSNSWGGGSSSASINNAITSALNLGRDGKGCVVVFASGNRSEEVSYPANSNSEILVVGAMSPCGERKTPNSCDNERSWGSNYGESLDIVAPGVLIPTTINNNSYSLDFRGTSSATPHVAGVAALVLSVAPELTGQQVRDIIESTAKKVSPDFHTYHYTPTPGRNNGDWNHEMGYGLVDAYQAVLKAQQYLKPDFHIRNSVVDMGLEPDPFSINEDLYQSPDIWVRLRDDGRLEHQNPEYHRRNRNYVYVRVKNIGDKTSTVKDSLRLHWAKASTALTFPRYWDGSFQINNTPMGGVIGTAPIPILEPGATAVVKFPWSVPDPNDYKSITPNNNDPWHFCLLGRVLSEDDPMTFIETADLVANVRNNNNVAWKNLSIVEVEDNKPYGVYVLVGNPNDRIENYLLEFKVPKITENELLKKAEIRATLSPDLYKAWVRGGMQGPGVKRDKQENTVLLVEPNARLENLELAPQEHGTLHLSFNFLTKELHANNEFASGATPPAEEEYLFNVAQKYMEDELFLGGESYLIRKKRPNPFYADAGLDREVNRGETVYLQASDIGEPATYNWYNTDGEWVYSGKNYSLSLEQNQKIQLEVIAADGFKDYDEVELKLKPNYLERIVPNPASESVQIYYHITQAQQAYISIAPMYAVVGNEVNYPIAIGDTSINIDLTSFASGLYKVSLYVNQRLVDSKNLLVE